MSLVKGQVNRCQGRIVSHRARAEAEATATAVRFGIIAIVGVCTKLTGLLGPGFCNNFF